MPLTADVVGGWGGVELIADLSANTPVPALIRVTRTNSATGETVTVRGADPVYSPGGVAYGFDHEAPLGVVVTYSAQGYTAADVATGAPVEAVLSTSTVAAHMAWVKSITEPSLSRVLMVAAIGPLARRRRRETFEVLGRSNLVTQSRGLSGREGRLEVLALSMTEADDIDALLSQDTLLVQFPPQLGILDLYASVGDVTPTPVGPRRMAVQRWETTITEKDRPSTAGSGLRAPGWSWDAAAATWADWGAVAAARASWVALASE